MMRKCPLLLLTLACPLTMVCRLIIERESLWETIGSSEKISPELVSRANGYRSRAKLFYKNVLVSHDVELCAGEAHVRAGGGGNNGDNQPRNKV